MKLATRRFGLAAALALAGILACGLPGNGEPTDQPAGDAREASVSQDAQGVSSLDQVKSATIQIQAEGTFLDPEFGLLINAAGRGSGFIIDPSGIAVTNNHVVTGAGLLKVWIGGETQAHNAKVLGVSECSDLAVIDIDGEGYPYLQWHNGQIGVGLEVYAAGFPLGDPEYTLTKGIVSKERASGEVSWASVDEVLEHDANINPGNSGGPLVDAQGRVVGINYAGSQTLGQFFAIKQAEAQGIIEQLRAGKDVHSIGINGQAVMSDDGSLSGIWVSSVASGSQADQAGVQSGDILTALEGLLLGLDGTMSDYCDVLRTHSPGDTLSIEVLRWSTGEVLTGQLNGRELETALTFEAQAEQSLGDSQATGAYAGYVLVTDDYGSIQLEIPAEWAEVDGSPWLDAGEVIGASIYAAPSLEGFLNTWSTPGVIFNVSDDLARLGGYIQLLDLFRPDFMASCKLDGRYDYQDAFYRGKFDWFDNCGGAGGASMMVLSAVPADNSQAFLILVQVQMLSDADVEAAQRILDTFQVVGVLP